MGVMFKDVNNVPPGGLYFYETHGEKAVARTFLEIAPKVRALMRKYNIPGLAEEAVAAYMCPRIPNPGAYCTGGEVPRAHVTARDAIANSLPYCRRPVVAFDEIERRMRICAKCPAHKRDWCPTCTGHVSRMMDAFGGRRTKLPEDAVSGVCQRAKAYEIAICSAEYAKGEKPWEGIPELCWRNRDD